MAGALPARHHLVKRAFGKCSARAITQHADNIGMLGATTPPIPATERPTHARPEPDTRGSDRARLDHFLCDPLWDLWTSRAETPTFGSFTHRVRRAKAPPRSLTSCPATSTRYAGWQRPGPPSRCTRTTASRWRTLPAQRPRSGGVLPVHTHRRGLHRFVDQAYTYSQFGFRTPAASDLPTATTSHLHPGQGPKGWKVFSNADPTRGRARPGSTASRPPGSCRPTSRSSPAPGRRPRSPRPTARHDQPGRVRPRLHRRAPGADEIIEITRVRASGSSRRYGIAYPFCKVRPD